MTTLPEVKALGFTLDQVICPTFFFFITLKPRVE